MTIARLVVLIVAVSSLVPSALLAQPLMIRVALVEQARTAELAGADIEVSALPACARCERARWRTDTVRAVTTARGVEIDGRQAPGFTLVSDGPILLNRRQYSGELQVVKNGDGLTIVNTLPLEDYIVGVVRAEMPEDWPVQALRAQAIVARTYAAYQRMVNAGKAFHVVASTADQMFAGGVPASSPTWDAVRETMGEVLEWEGRLFPTFFHSASGGYTDDPRLVFVSAKIAAFKAVRDPFSAGSPNARWGLDLKLADLSETLRKNGVQVGTVTDIEVSERTPSLRAVSVTVHGTEGSARLRGTDFRRMIGYETLKSTLFAVAVDGNIAHFAGRGYGHGVGLSQWGARGMAERGYQAREIVAFYYPGATIGWLDEDGVTRP